MAEALQKILENVDSLHHPPHRLLALVLGLLLCFLLRLAFANTKKLQQNCSDRMVPDALYLMKKGVCQGSHLEFIGNLLIAHLRTRFTSRHEDACTEKSDRA